MTYVKPFATLMVDTEFNGTGGVLISAAFVDTRTGQYWYNALAPSMDAEPYVPFVKENVIPHLGVEPLPLSIFIARLRQWLNQFGMITFIYNARQDRGYLNELLLACGEVPMHTFIRDGHLSGKTSTVPHNALADAEAMLDVYLGTKELKGFGVISDRDVINALQFRNYPVQRCDVVINYIEKLEDNSVRVEVRLAGGAPCPTGWTELTIKPNEPK